MMKTKILLQHFDTEWYLFSRFLTLNQVWLCFKSTIPTPYGWSKNLDGYNTVWISMVKKHIAIPTVEVSQLGISMRKRSQSLPKEKVGYKAFNHNFFVS